jgi:hypothetical protein
MATRALAWSENKKRRVFRKSQEREGKGKGRGLSGHEGGRRDPAAPRIARVKRSQRVSLDEAYRAQRSQSCTRMVFTTKPGRG